MPLPAVVPHDQFWRTLDLRLTVVRSCFRDACGELSAKSGIHHAMAHVDEAIALASQDSKAKLSPDMGRAMGLIWRLGNSLTILAERRIDYSNHLKMMRHGEAVFGQRDPQDKTTFKDFELEIHVAAQLCDRSKRRIALHEPGQPFDITMGDALRIECKHPSAEKDPGIHELDFLSLGPIESMSGPKPPSNFNRYLCRSLDIDVVGSQAQAFVFCKPGPMCFLGFISPAKPGVWEGTKIESGGGIFTGKSGVPSTFGDYLSGQAEKTSIAQDKLSERQREVIQRAIEKDLDRVARSDSFAALDADVRLSGREEVFPRDGSDPRS
jgi:hypothetical protein